MPRRKAGRPALPSLPAASQFTTDAGAAADPATNVSNAWGPTYTLSFSHQIGSTGLHNLQSVESKDVEPQTWREGGW